MIGKRLKENMSNKEGGENWLGGMRGLEGGENGRRKEEGCDEGRWEWKEMVVRGDGGKGRWE